MEHHNEEPPRICSWKRYVVALTINNNQIIDVVLGGQTVEVVRNALARPIPERNASIHFENDGYDYYIPTSSIAYMIVSKTRIIEDPED